MAGAPLDTLRIRTEVDNSALKKGFNEARQEARKTGKGIKKSLNEADKSAKKLTRSADGLGRTFAVVAAAATAASVKMLAFASSVQEDANRATVVFGASAVKVEEDLTKFGDAVGRSRHDLTTMASVLQDTLVPMGLARDRAADLSSSLTKLAVDAAAFTSTDPAVAIQDFQSGLVGATRGLRKYGIVITEVTTKEAAYANGIAEHGAELTELQKTQARAIEIENGLTDAKGAGEKRSKTYAGQTRRLKANFEDLVVALTTPKLKTAAGLLGAVADQLDRMEKSTVRKNRFDEITSGVLPATGAEVEARISEIEGYIGSRSIHRKFEQQGNEFTKLTGASRNDYIGIAADAQRQLGYQVQSTLGPNAKAFGEVSLFETDAERRRLRLATYGQTTNANALSSRGGPNEALYGAGQSLFDSPEARPTGGMLAGRGGRGVDRQMKKQQEALKESAEAVKKANEEYQEAFESTVQAIEAGRERVATSLSQGLAEDIKNTFKTGKLEFENFGKVIENFATEAIANFIKVQVIQRAFDYFLPGSGAAASTLLGGGRRGGGHVNKGQAYPVGEEGPELFVPPSVGRIVPNNMMGSGGPPVIVNQNITVTAGVAPTIKAELQRARPQFARDAVRAVVQAKQNGGVVGAVLGSR